MLHGWIARGRIFCELIQICSLPTIQGIQTDNLIWFWLGYVHVAWRRCTWRDFLRVDPDLQFADGAAAASRQSGPAAPFLTTPLLWTNQVQPISRLDFWIWHVTLFWKITRSQSKEINIYLSHHKSYRYSKDKTEMFYDLVEQRYKTKTFKSPIRCLRLWRQE